MGRPLRGFSEGKTTILLISSLEDMLSEKERGGACVASDRQEERYDLINIYLPGQRREGIGRRSGGRMIPEDILKRKWLKWAYRRL